MVNQNLLRAEIVRNGMTQRELANKIGMSESTFLRKMKKGAFGTDEVERMIVVLNINDPLSVFFDMKVS